MVVEGLEGVERVERVEGVEREVWRVVLYKMRDQLAASLSFDLDRTTLLQAFSPNTNSFRMDSVFFRKRFASNEKGAVSHGLTWSKTLINRCQSGSGDELILIFHCRICSLTHYSL